MALLGRSVRVVVHPEVDGLGRCQDWLGQMGCERVLVEDARAATPWSVVSSFDATMVAGATGRRRDAAGMLPVLWSMAAGRPVLMASGHPGAEEFADCRGVLCDVDARENLATKWILDRLSDKTLDCTSPLRIDEAAWCQQILSDYESLVA